MITAILDTNVLVQAAFGSPRSASFRVMTALDDGRFKVALSAETVDELIEVLSAPTIKARHGWSDDEILSYVLSLFADGSLYATHGVTGANLPRDLTDRKFLALAEAAAADYLVTNDRRHLLSLKQHGATRIVTPTRFLLKLQRR